MDVQELRSNFEIGGGAPLAARYWGNTVHFFLLNLYNSKTIGGNTCPPPPCSAVPDVDVDMAWICHTCWFFYLDMVYKFFNMDMIRMFFDMIKTVVRKLFTEILQQRLMYMQ